MLFENELSFVSGTGKHPMDYFMNLKFIQVVKQEMLFQNLRNCENIFRGFALFYQIKVFQMVFVDIETDLRLLAEFIYLVY